MASQPVTFPCPFCGKRMGVPAELLGRQVRCPHCKQVVVAPATAGTAPAAPAPVQVLVPPPAPVPVPAPAPVVVVLPPPAPEPLAPPEPELRAFNIPPKKESADSILSEPNESDDEVFGSQPGARLPAISSDPPPPPADEPAPVLDDPFGFGPKPAAPAPAEPRPTPQPLVTATLFDLPPNAIKAHAPAPSPPPPPADQTDAPNPFADLEPASVAPAVVPSPKPVAAPVPRPVALPQPVMLPPPPPKPAPAPAAPAGGNPFADFEEEPVPVELAPATAEVSDAEPPRKKKRREEDEDADRDEKPARSRGARPPAAADGGKTILLVLLAGYALVATALAVYGLFFKSSDPDTGHPLSTIPDNFGEFPPADRKKVSLHKFPVDGELPAAQRATLGETITIGQLEVRPHRVEKRPLHLKLESADGKENRPLFPGTALVLTLDIKNTGTLPVFPMDPAFNRRAKGAADQPITRLVVGTKTFAGGEIEWPLGAQFRKKIEEQQANDATPLRPGESRDYVIFTEAKQEVVKAAETSNDALQWRVQVRRGLIEYKGKEVPVTAVVGVDFKSSDIRTP